MFEQLKVWLDNNLIDYKFDPFISNDIFEVGGQIYLLIKTKRKGDYFPVEEVEQNDQILFDKDFHLVLSNEEKQIKCNYYCFEFGGNYYYTSSEDITRPTLTPLKYIGKVIKGYDWINQNYCPLGIHGKMEIMNGSRSYESWVSKSKFLGFNSLGITERNTLAGSLQFYLACQKEKIKPIIGEQITVKLKETDEEVYYVKCYCTNKQGWKDLLKLNKIINIEREGFVLQEELLTVGEGLIIVLKWDYPLNEYFIKQLKQKYVQVYYQIDSVIWQGEKQDIKYIGYLKEYLRGVFYNQIEPILIDDVYYLDNGDHTIKKLLNQIVKPVVQQFDSKRQYLKPLIESVENLQTLFKLDANDENSVMGNFIAKCINNVNIVNQSCNFEFELGKFHLPKFSFKHLPEFNSRFKDNNELLFHLLDEGMVKYGLKGKKEYEDRIEEELLLLYKGKFIDYMLITYDILRHCREKGYTVGFGRGSSGGSLVSYLLNITRVDPLKFNLLFSRFLTEGRIGKSMPDIDSDLPVSNREDVKKYIEDLYGKNYFCSVGAYVNSKIKSGIKDLGRQYRLPFETINILTSILYFPEGSDGTYEQLFKSALENSLMKNFVIKNTKLINQLFYILKSPKASKVHPSAVIIYPKYEGEDIWDVLPMRKDSEGNVICEWEGEQLEKAGYLKEDILGLEQLDKFKFIIALIKKTTGKDFDIYNDIDYNDKKVFNYFSNGFTSDVFQFNSSGQTKYCKQIKPTTINELINMLAIWRPGPIQSNVHNIYLNIKNGISVPEYDFGLEEVTKDTFGVIIFQEQIMLCMKVLGDFNEVEQDDIRKGMGKKQEKVLLPYKKQFLKKAIEKGCPDNEAEEIWSKAIRFSSYAFNKSHSACYAHMGYASQYLKVHYSLAFWATSLNFAKEEKGNEQIPRYIAEIRKTSTLIKIVPPDINKSTDKFEVDYERGLIYFSLNKVKYLGQLGLDIIFQDRLINGKYYSIGEFYQRVPRVRSINKRVVINLILCGAFDELYGITDNVKDRLFLIKDYAQIAELDESKIEILNNPNNQHNYYFTIIQRQLCSYGYIDFKILCNKYLKQNSNFIDGIELQDDENIDKYVSFGIIITYVSIRKSKKGPYCYIEGDCNSEKIRITAWNSEYEKFVNQLKKENEGKILLLNNCRVIQDNYNVCQSLVLSKNTELYIL